uniref:TGB2 n=1 Tax=Phyllanthus potexvirus 1 TaxID=2794412 RepID=A0A7T5QZ76_9VIRU|nr:TGB2 [Phyllanthus potexvirus 1]
MPPHLTPPRDYTPLLAPLALGFSIALVAFFLSRSNLPHAGDNIHSLPHGGCYRDGTKRVTYNGPGGVSAIDSISRLASRAPFWIVLLVLGIPLAIYALERRGHGPHCPRCAPAPAST